MDIAKKIVPYLTAIASLAVGVLVFFLADVEGLLWSLQKEPPVNGEDIVSVDSEHWLGDVSGREAGEGGWVREHPHRSSGLVGRSQPCGLCDGGSGENL